MNLRKTLIVGVILAIPFGAHAQAVNGLYVSVGVGGNSMPAESINSAYGVAFNNVSLQNNPGPVVVGSVGWGYGNGLRTEAEFGYRYNSTDKVNLSGESLPVSGSEQKFGSMFNVLYDFTAIAPVVTPYVGLGIGYQWINEAVNLSGISTSDTKGAFAYQAIVGAAFPVNLVPGLFATAEYRFLGTAGERNYSGIKLGNDENHSIIIGLRYAFGSR